MNSNEQLPGAGAPPEVGNLPHPPNNGVVVSPESTTRSDQQAPAAGAQVAEPMRPSTELASPPVATPPAPGRAASVHDILNDSVTRHMRNATPLLQTGQTVAESIEMLRASQDVGRVIYFYVVDEERRLKGVVAARKLLLAPPTRKIAEIMSTHAITIPSTATVLEACEFFTLHRLLAFPIVDADRRIVGAVDVDLYTDEIREIDRREDSDDLFQLIGIHLAEATQPSARRAFLGRFPWLLSNVLGGMLSAWIADAYQDVSTLAVVAPFIALVTALAESVSIQSVSLALQALHAGPVKWASFARKIRLEAAIGFLLGGACGLIVAVVAWVWKRDLTVAASLLLGITGGVVASAGVGLSIPFVLKLFRRDPQLAAGPIALALSDIVTLFCYFNLGRWLLG